MTAETANAPKAEGAAGTQQAPDHPLETSWCFWLRQKDGSRDWQQQHIMGHKFSTVEDFWCMINNLVNPFESNSNCDFSVFREGMTPDYDLPPFKEGGRIILQLRAGGPGSSYATKHFDVWVHLLLALIGENFEDDGGEYIGGLRLVNKAKGGPKFEIWTTTRQRDEMERLALSLLKLTGPLIDNVRDRQSLRAKFAEFPGNEGFEVTMPADH